jgi:hypothetical protein
MTVSSSCWNGIHPEATESITTACTTFQVQNTMPGSDVVGSYLGLPINWTVLLDRSRSTPSRPVG